MRDERGVTKCVVWDCDDTLWEGTLLEGGGQRLKPGIETIIRALDGRGILQSIASKNNRDDVVARLDALGVGEFFVAPQVGWYPKSAMLKNLCEVLNIGENALMMVDDLAFELDEIRSELPNVVCIDAAAYATLPDLPHVNPAVISRDARERRLRYQEEACRKFDQKRFEGPADAFLEGLGMRMRIARATEDDLERAEELTRRTNQMNTTGIPYDRDTLHALLDDERFAILICHVDDRYGPYGMVGLALVELGDRDWRIRLFLTSCRVVNRGVGNAFLHTIINCAVAARRGVTADWRGTGRNRPMEVTYRLAGFRSDSVEAADPAIQVLRLEAPGERAVPPYIAIDATAFDRVPESCAARS
ncbi:HAD-IIIC family phosphatase [Burkholderia contaminans]|uniref:HAD-IIIC family phosphatase n=1 Tax=Burkholderia contaminans TaxID=488447 RepID=UPI001588BD82|nr:HAD-IIIC family phosphatase [Burkholderia contaminans]